MASRSPGLLGRLRRPSVAPSAWSRERRLRDCDHADRAPAASLRIGTSAPDRSAARVARQRHCVDRAALPEGSPGTFRARHAPVGRPMSANSGAVPARPGERLARVLFGSTWDWPRPDVPSLINVRPCGAFRWVEGNAEHCQGGQSRATAMTSPCRDRVEGWPRFPSAPAFSLVAV